jgi:hypothetical protein
MPVQYCISNSSAVPEIPVYNHKFQYGTSNYSMVSQNSSRVLLISVHYLTFQYNI